jgi:hypothetical protein
MVTKIILKNSSETGKSPSLSDLELGELAINTYDGDLYLKEDKDGEMSVVRFTRDNPVENVIFVQKGGSDSNRGDSWDSAYLTIEKALENAWTREGAIVLIEIGPGIYTTRGHLDMPDNSIIHCTYRSVKIRPEPGYEERNVFRMGSGCFIEGPVFEGFRVDSFDDPSEGFAAVFRPGAVIFRTPYVHKIAVRSITTWTQIAPPLDRANGNPYVPRGGGVVMADGNVISPYSVYPNIMTWGATPVIHNGVGYVAKNGALINAVNAISIWAHKHFYAINGGQIVLSGCSTQFGDYTLIAEGVRNIIVPYALDSEITANNTAGEAVYSAANTIINGMWANLVSEGYTTNWPSTYENFTRTDANLLLRSLSWTLDTGNEKPVNDFSKGFFDAQGDRVFVAADYDYEKCFRDTGLISEAVSYDVMFGSNYRTVSAALSYHRANASLVITDQLSDTITALTRQKATVGSYLSGNTLIRSNNLFDEVIDVVTNGPSSANTYVFPDPTSYDSGFSNARRLLVNNKEFIKSEVDSWIKYQIDNNIAPFSSNNVQQYDQATCSRDVGLIIDSIGYDMMFGSNIRAVTAGRSYYRQGAAVVTEQQKAATIGAFKYLKTQVVGVSSNTAAIDRFESGMDIIIDILDNGLSSTPTLIAPVPTSGNTNSSDTGFLNARNRIDQNRNFIRSEIIAYMDAKYPSIEYNREKCSRDVDYILDAVFFDMTYGGNLETKIAANSYYSGNVLQLGADEKAPTIDAYTYLQDLISNIADNTVIVPYQDVVNRVTGAAGSAGAAAYASALIGVIIETIRTGSSQPTLTPDVSWVSNSLKTDFTATQTSKSQIQSNVITYVNSYFDRLVYDRDLCSRDVGLIVDAVGYDLMFNSNFRSVTAARSYRRSGAAAVTNGQRAVTVAALEYLKDRLFGIGNPISTVAGQRVVSNLELITNTVADDAFVIPYAINEFTITAPTGGTNNSFVAKYADARNAIESNRSTLKNNVINFIATNYPAVANTYSQSACRRDIDLILNATYYDLTYGGNLETVVAAKSYYSNAVLQLGAGEKAATIAAYTYMRDEIGTIVSVAANNALGDVAETLIQTIINTIDTGTSPSEITPSTTWVASPLIDSATALQANKTITQQSVIDYIDSEFVYGYDIVKCKRDVGLIVDALQYDLTYGGNLATRDAAAAYFVGTTAQYGTGEKLASAAALTRMSNALVYVLQANTVPDISIGNEEVQYVTGPAGSLSAATFAQTRVNEIVSTINNNGTLPSRILPGTAWVASEYTNAFSNINTNKIAITLDVMEYLAKETNSLLGAFLTAYDFIQVKVKDILGQGSYEASIVSNIFINIKNTIMNPVVVEEPSIISAIGHTWTAIMSGVALTKMPPATNKANIQDSILELNKGVVTASGQDDQGSALFVGGLEINADTGELTGPPFQQAVNRISTRAAISRSF